MVVVDGVVGLSEPGENDVIRCDVAVARGIICEGVLLKFLHVKVREWAAGGFTHPKSLELPIEVAPLSEIGQVEVEFDQGQDVVNPDGGALVKIPMIESQLKVQFHFSQNRSVFHTFFKPLKFFFLLPPTQGYPTSL